MCEIPPAMPECLFITADITTLSVLYNDLSDHFPGRGHEALLGRLVSLVKTEGELEWSLGSLAWLQTEGVQGGSLVGSEVRSVVRSEAT